MSDKIFQVDGSALHKLSYGLFALFTNDGKRDNACIINTAIQVTDKPKTISICVNKANYTNETIKRTGEFCLSVISEDAPFDMFSRFGFSSGRDCDKLQGFDKVITTECGLKALSAYSNSYICGRVIQTVEQGSHTIFIAEVIEAKKISTEPSMTYAYYFSNVKPKPEASGGGENKKIVGWRCKICNFEYREAELPSDYICPLCKHPAEDFEPIYE